MTRPNHWIPLDRIEPLIHLELYVVAFAVGAGAWFFYRYFLRSISARRHESLKRRFLTLLMHFGSSSLLAAAFWLLQDTSHPLLSRVDSYLGLFALLTGAMVWVRLAQVLLYLYLFFANMSVGVPRLIANIFTLIFAILIYGWLAAEVFSLRIGPVLATSAIFSVVLGLALQDTLGNLFSGVAIQLDKPFQIGDWVEVHNGNQKWVGQIQEISWRATLLMAFGNELISIPNRTMAQSQVLIFSNLQKPPRQAHTFRFPLGTPVEKAKAALLEATASVPEVLTDPEPVVLLSETSESCLVLKLFYSLSDFGLKYRAGDRILMRALQALERQGIGLAHPTLQLIPHSGRSQETVST